MYFRGTGYSFRLNMHQYQKVLDFKIIRIRGFTLQLRISMSFSELTNHLGYTYCRSLVKKMQHW